VGTVRKVLRGSTRLPFARLPHGAHPAVPPRRPHLPSVHARTRWRARSSRRRWVSWVRGQARDASVLTPGGAGAGRSRPRASPAVRGAPAERVPAGTPRGPCVPYWRMVQVTQLDVDRWCGSQYNSSTVCRTVKSRQRSWRHSGSAWWNVALVTVENFLGDRDHSFRLDRDGRSAV